MNSEKNCDSFVCCNSKLLNCIGALYLLETFSQFSRHQIKSILIYLEVNLSTNNCYSQAEVPKSQNANRLMFHLLKFNAFIEIDLMLINSYDN